MHDDSAIIGIHGLANKPPAEEKRKWWRAAIEEGMERNCAYTLPDVPLDFVYWADIRNETPLDDRHNREPYYRAPGSGPFPSHAPGSTNGWEINWTDRFYRVVGWVQEKTGLAPLDDLLIEYRLDDLYGYLEDPDFRDAARARLREAIEHRADRSILLAAHSMGSLIAYDVLRLLEREGANLRIAHLVTMGAPLGLADVKLKMEAEHGDLVVPQAVARWSNLLDRNDIATIGQDIGEAYAPNAHGVRARDVPVINAYRRPRGDLNRHKSYGYLRTPEFSRAVRDFLEEPTPAARVDAGPGLDAASRV